MRKFILTVVLAPLLVLSGCALNISTENQPIANLPDTINEQQTENVPVAPTPNTPAETAQNTPAPSNAKPYEPFADTNCTRRADLINEYGCHPTMRCDAGQVCREGLCVNAKNAPNEYGCHPSMYCDPGQVCRNGMCVNEKDAPDAYGCHPTMRCDANEVCRNGLCIKICPETVR